MNAIQNFLDSLSVRQLMVLKYMVNSDKGKELLMWYFSNSENKVKINVKK